MFDTFMRRAMTTLKVLWWVTVVGGATTIGAMYGWQGHGWEGALAAWFPDLLLIDLLEQAFVGLFRFFWN
ncbi:hypothetical protein M2267_001390 [Ensifer sp. KUDG1]|uniref:hypothetical protein n=1 Tax=Ensifer sp. KUDG1 TaxID=3373919 RepID=UPI003D21C54A